MKHCTLQELEKALYETKLRFQRLQYEQHSPVAIAENQLFELVRKYAIIGWYHNDEKTTGN